MRAIFRAFVLAPLTLIALLTASAHAHSTDFILAKVTAREGGVDLELTADYGGNPMFASKAEAQEVLTKVLRARVNGADSNLTALAPLRFEERKQFDPTTPIPLDPATGGESHQLLCAVWKWEGNSGKIAFHIADDSNQTGILWTPPSSAKEQPRWVFLLPGEVSPEIPIPHRTFPLWLTAGMSVGLVGLSTRICFGLFARGAQ